MGESHTVISMYSADSSFFECIIPLRESKIRSWTIFLIVKVVVRTKYIAITVGHNTVLIYRPIRFLLELLILFLDQFESQSQKEKFKLLKQWFSNFCPYFNNSPSKNTPSMFYLKINNF